MFEKDSSCFCLPFYWSHIFVWFSVLKHETFKYHNGNHKTYMSPMTLLSCLNRPYPRKFGLWSHKSSLHDRRFMSQAGRTRYFTRSARRGEEKSIFHFPSSRASRSCRAPREISPSPRLAHKAPVMQATQIRQMSPQWHRSCPWFI